MHWLRSKQCSSRQTKGRDSGLSECSEIRLRVHTVFRGSGVYEWICLFIDVCVLCLSHSSGLVWPVCKHARTRDATSLQGSPCRADCVWERQRERGRLQGSWGTWTSSEMLTKSGDFSGYKCTKCIKSLSCTEMSVFITCSRWKHHCF